MKKKLLNIAWNGWEFYMKCQVRHYMRHDWFHFWFGYVTMPIIYPMCCWLNHDGELS